MGWAVLTKERWKQAWGTEAAEKGRGRDTGGVLEGSRQ